MTGLHERLRRDLAEALRGRDRELVRVLRTVLAAVANAEAHPDPRRPPASRAGGTIAGAVHGLGAAEVARRELDEEEVRAIVERERAERLATADDLTARGATEPAGRLRADAARLDRYL